MAEDITSPDDGHELFYYAYRAFTAVQDARLATRGWGRVHHRVLHFIGRHPGMSVQALLDKLGVTKQALNAPLRALIEAGLVSAAPDKHDRRVKCLTLTPAGQRAEAELSDPQLHMLAQVFDACGPQAVAGWEAVMKAIARRS
ncbi:MAG: MarR family transcriptional regulator [Rhodocyclaceae bacterium]